MDETKLNVRSWVMLRPVLLAVVVAALGAYVWSAIGLIVISYDAATKLEFHARVLKVGALIFTACLLGLGLISLLPTGRESRRRNSMEEFFCWAVVFASALLAWRHATELRQGTAQPGLMVCGAVTLLVPAILAGSSALIGRNAGRMLLLGAGMLVPLLILYLQTQLQMPVFSFYNAQLRALILSAALFLIGVALLVKLRHSSHVHTLAAFSTGLCFLFSLTHGDFASPPPVRLDDSSSMPVILITIDTLRADALGCYGGTSVKTPAIDALARDGILFRHAHSGGPWTYIGMAGIFTGEDVWVHQCNDLDRSLATSFLTPAESFRAAGYPTYAVVHNGLLEPGRGFDQGFDDYVYIESKSTRNETHFVLRHLPNWLTKSDLADHTQKITVNAISLLRQNHANPFFLWLHYLDPHSPYSPPLRLMPTNAHSTDRQRDLYLAEVQYVDECIGRVLNELRALGLYDRSLIVLSSDHGEEFHEHGGESHAHALWNELIDVPLLWKNPNSSKGIEVGNHVHTAWIGRTLLARAGIVSLIGDEPPLPGILESQGAEWIRPIHSGGIRPDMGDARSVILGDWKLIDTYKPRPITRLFNLKTDPLEQHDLAAEHPEKKAELLKQIADFRAACETRRQEILPNIEDITHEISEEGQAELRALGYLK